MRVVDAFLDPILKAAIEKAQKGTQAPQEVKDEIGEDETLLDHLVKYTQGGSSSLFSSCSPPTNVV